MKTKILRGCHAGKLGKLINLTPKTNGAIVKIKNQKLWYNLKELSILVK